MPTRLPRRENLAALILAPATVGSLAFAWLHRDSIHLTAGTQKTVRLDAPIPRDTNVLTAELRNGLRYYVRSNSAPEHRAELRLAINAGSVLEADDQYGLAHAVEHMLFRGTKRFPKGAVEDYLQSIGMRSGTDINASTSEDETIVRITVPTSRPGAIDTAIAILADMAHEATFDPHEARDEGGVVMSEWRSRSNISLRKRDARDALLLANSSYATHSVIGDTATLRKFDVAAMRRFYKDWYRPELMSVIAVGDFDELKVVSQIRKEFSEIPKSQTPAPKRPDTTVPRPSVARATSLVDPEATASSITLWYPRAARHNRTLGDAREEIVGTLWSRVLNERLEDAAGRPGAALLGASAGSASLTRSLTADVVSAFAAESREGAAIEAMVTEIERLARYGITEAELKTAGDAVLRERRRATQWADNSSDLADALVDEFLGSDLPVDRDMDYQIVYDLMPTITAADFLLRARRVALDSGAVIVLTQPLRGREPTTPGELIRVAKAASTAPLERLVDSSATVALLPVPPTPGRIASETTISEAHAFDWRLSNGMRVVLKPTRFSYDQIEFRLIGSGGSSLATDADYASAYSADEVIASTGVGPLNGTRLSRRLENMSMTFSAGVNDEAVSINGRAGSNQLETLFQLLYLHFTAPRADTTAFRRFQERRTSIARRRTADPDELFADSIAALMSGHHPRAVKRGSRFTNDIRLGAALDFWKTRMSHTAGFTLVLTGDFALDGVRPLVARYLASLPAREAEQPRDVGLRFPGGITRRTIVAGVGPRARTEIAWSGAYDGTSDASDALGIVRDLAGLALTDRLRERLGETYGVDVSTSVSLVPPARYTISVNFETAPERADSLASAAIDELERLRSKGPTDADYQKVKAARTRDRDGDSESNRYWASELSWHTRMGWPLGTIAQHQTETELLSKGTLQRACETYLSTSAYVQLTMLPATR